MYRCVKYMLFVALLSLQFGSLSPVYGVGKEELNEKLDTAQYITDTYLEGVAKLLSEGGAVARPIFEKILQIDPNHSGASFMMSELVQNEDPNKALEYAERSVEQEPENMWFKQRLSELYAQVGDYNNSLKLIKEVNRSLYRSVESYSYESALYGALGDKEMAGAIIDSTIALYGNDISLLMQKGEILRDQGKGFDYLVNAKSIYSLNPGSKELTLYLANSYAMVKQDSLADVTYRAAYALDSTDLAIQSAMVEFYKGRDDDLFFKSLLGIFGSLEVELTKKIDYYDSELRTQYYYTNHLTRLEMIVNYMRSVHNYIYEVESFYIFHLINSERTEEIPTVLDKFFAEDNFSTLSEEDKRDLYRKMIGIQVRLNDKDSALKYIDKAKDLFQGDIEEMMYISYSYSECEEIEKGINVLKSTIKCAPTDSLKSVLYCQIADLGISTSSDSAKYLKYYKKAVACDPSNIIALNNYAYTLSLYDTKRLQEAKEMSAKVIEMEPSNATYLDTYAWILYLMGEYKEAKDIQRKALALDNTGNKEIFMHYADILAAIGESYNAKIYYRKALESGAAAEVIERKLEKL